MCSNQTSELPTLKGHNWHKTKSSFPLFNWSNGVSLKYVSDITFAQLWKADAVWEDNQAFKKHFRDQPDRNALIKTESFKVSNYFTTNPVLMKLWWMMHRITVWPKRCLHHSWEENRSFIYHCCWIAAALVIFSYSQTHWCKKSLQSKLVIKKGILWVTNESSHSSAMSGSVVCTWQRPYSWTWARRSLQMKSLFLIWLSLVRMPFLAHTFALDGPCRFTTL